MTLSDDTRKHLAAGSSATLSTQLFKVARDAFEQEQLEQFVQGEIAAGRPLPGVYPPNAETRARYEAWKRKTSRTAE